MARKKGRRTLERPTGPEYGDDNFDYRKGASMKYNTYEDIGLDEEDEFHDQREEISLDESLLRRRKDDHSDSEEEVYGLDVDDSLDEDEEEGDDERLLEKLTRDQRMKTSDDEEEAEGEEGDLDDDRAWGRRRGMFYNADEASDEEEAQEEEKEALRLQRLQTSKMRAEDYIDDFADSLGARAAADAKSSTLATSDTLDDIDHLAISSSLPLHLLPSGTAAELEVVEKGTSGMSEEERMRLAESMIPEVVQLLGEFERRWVELQTRIGPAVRWSVQEGKRNGKEIGEAEKYLQLKYRLLISYLTNLSFYLSLRAHPPPSTDITTHPVVDTLVTLQELLDSIETKIEGKIALSDDESEEEDGEEDTVERRKRRKRKRKERRRLEKEAEGMRGFMEEVEDIVRKGAEGGEEEGVEEEGDAEGMEVDVLPVANGVKRDKPKLKKRKKFEAAMAKLEPSKPAVKVRKGLAEADLVIPEVEYKPDAKLKKKGEKEKKKKKKDAVVDDFGDGLGLEDVDYEDKLERKRGLQFHVTRVDQTIAARQRKTAGLGDDDIPYRDRFGKVLKSTTEEKPAPSAPLDVGGDDSALDYDAIAAALAAEDAKLGKRKRGGVEEEAGEDDVDGWGGSDGGEGEGGEEDEDDALAYYESISNGRKEKKMQREREVLEAKAAAEESLYDDNDFTSLAEGAKRAASYQILANKGLTPRRNKLQRNPRLKKRRKFEKAQKRLGSYRAVAVDKSKVGAYAGERSGIKRDLAKSVRIK
ncbi:hypothetical protein HDV00_001640 [Rhizophlyctis rosea]|nr:hypothetical protein HDV00_001640 [Rhizophlyctis rosea]